MKERSWAEHLTSLPIKGVGTLLLREGLLHTYNVCVSPTLNKSPAIQHSGVIEIRDEIIFDFYMAHGTVTYLEVGVTWSLLHATVLIEVMKEASTQAKRFANHI